MRAPVSATRWGSGAGGSGNLGTWEAGGLTGVGAGAPVGNQESRNPEGLPEGHPLTSFLFLVPPLLLGRLDQASLRVCSRQPSRACTSGSPLAQRRKIG
jgi:hypothetical protein